MESTKQWTITPLHGLMPIQLNKYHNTTQCGFTKHYTKIIGYLHEILAALVTHYSDN